MLIEAASELRNDPDRSVQEAADTCESDLYRTKVDLKEEEKMD
jgi:hypothetical protein